MEELETSIHQKLYDMCDDEWVLNEGEEGMYIFIEGSGWASLLYIYAHFESLVYV